MRRNCLTPSNRSSTKSKFEKGGVLGRISVARAGDVRAYLFSVGSPPSQWEATTTCS
jgi:hypothetical protein